MFTALGWILAALLLWSLTLFLYGVAYSRGEDISQSAIRAQVAVLGVLLCATVAYFLGFREYGSPRLPVEKQLRFEHRGFYTGPAGRFVFSGSPEGDQFPAAHLQDDERIVLHPAPLAPPASPATAPKKGSAKSDSQIHEWTVLHKCWKYPLRIDGKASNLNPDWWLEPNDALYFYSGNAFFSLRWKVEPAGLFSGVRNTIEYSDGTGDRAGRVFRHKDVVLTHRVFHDGMPVGTLLRHPSEEFAKTVGSIAEPLVQMADSAILVRERLGDSTSRLGVLLDTLLFNTANAAVFRNEQRLSMNVLAFRRETPLASGTLLAYGLGEKNRLAFRLPLKYTDSARFGPVILLPFLQPVWWKMPQDSKREFLITARQEDSPKPGYWIDVGDPENAFYAKASLSAEGSALSLNDGRSSEVYSRGADILLGNPSHGALVALGEMRQRVRYAGWIAFGLVAFHTLLFIFLVPRDTAAMGTRINIAYSVLWCAVLTILVIRVMLAFRVSLLPPDDAIGLPIFDKSLTVSLLALAAIPLGLLLPAFYNRVRRSAWLANRSALDWSPTMRFFMVASLAGSAYVLLGKFLGHNESFAGVRISYGAVGLMVLVLAAAARSWLDSGPFVSVCFFFVLLLPLCFNILVIKDRGSYVYFLPFLLAGLIRWKWHRKIPMPWGWRTVLAAAAVFLALGPLLLTFAGRIALRQRQIGPGTETLYYRLMVQNEAQSEVLAQDAEGTPIVKRLLLTNIHQSWQMLLYSSEGATRPRKFGGVPLSNRGMSYPVLLTDTLYSSLVLSEHGIVAAWALAFIYVLLSLACFTSAWFLSERTAHRAVPLLVIGSLFAINALYMATSNIGWAVFTGLNMPLLGLYSGSDTCFWGGLLLLAAFLSVAGIRTSPLQPLRGEHPWVLWIGRCFVAALLLWSGVLLAALFSLRSSSTKHYMDDYALDKNLVAQVRNDLNLSPDRKNACWSFENDTLKPLPGCSPIVLEKLAVDQFNLQVDKRNSNAGFLYLDGTEIRVNENYFRVSSPFHERNLWGGQFLARGNDSGATFVLLGKPFQIALHSTGRIPSIVLGAPVPDRVGSSVLITDGLSHPRICEFSRYPSGDVTVSSKGASGWHIFVEGADIAVGKTTPVGRRCSDAAGKDEAGCRKLAEGDIIVLEKHNRANHVDRLYNLIYLGVRPTSLAYAKWVNGGERHVYPQSDTFPMAFAVVRALDRLSAENRPSQLSLTIDMPLQRAVQSAVNRFARNNPHYSDNAPNYDPTKTSRLAVTAIDAYTGDVLALAGWPLVDPGDESFEKNFNTASDEQQRRMIWSPNFFNHVVGSTFKPLVFSSVASQLWPEYRLEDMKVYNRSDKVIDLPPSLHLVHPHLRLGNLELPNKSPFDCKSTLAEIDARTYLVRSQNYYEVMVGLIGSFRRKSDWTHALVRGTPPDLTYNQLDYKLDLKLVPDSPFSTDPIPFSRTEAMKDTLLFRALPQLFTVGIGGTEAGALAEDCKQFLPSLCPSGPEQTKNDVVALALPEPVMLQPQKFQQMGDDYVKGFLVGGRLSKWNNVRMAEAGARLITGRQVSSHLEEFSSAHPAPEVKNMPAPLDRLDWRTRHLVEPMRDVVEGGGTASRLAHLVPAPYTLVAKTGTIDEGAGTRESEAMMAVLGERRGVEFIPGRTIAIYLYLEQSKEKSDSQGMKKFDFAKDVFRQIVGYLNEHAEHPSVGAASQADAVPPREERPGTAAASQERPSPDVVAEPAGTSPDTHGTVENMLEKNLQGVVSISTEDGSGSGFFAGSSCLIVTNWHVVSGASQITVTTHSGVRRAAEVVSHSAAKDLALLRAPVRSCVTLSMRTEPPHLGDEVFVIGDPLGLRGSVSRGIVGGVRTFRNIHVVQVDAAMNPGNSGGPVMNREGQVLGVSTFTLGESVGLNFATASSEVLSTFGTILR